MGCSSSKTGDVVVTTTSSECATSDSHLHSVSPGQMPGKANGLDVNGGGGTRTAETSRAMASSNSAASLTVQTGGQPAEVSQQPSPQTSQQRLDQASSDALPHSSPPGTTQRLNSLIVPGSEEALGTASARKRSSMKPTDGTKREIPPKSPTVPLRRPTHGGGPMDAAAFPHATSGGVNGAPSGVTYAHAGHHGFGPGNLAHGDSPVGDAVDPDASTQKINSDTDQPTTSRPIDAAGVLPGYSDRHGASNGLGSHKGKKRLRRQTSHKGLLSRLALQFPSIRASFQKVHNVFERYHQERVRELMDKQNHPPPPPAAAAATTATTAPEVASPSSNKVTDGALHPSPRPSSATAAAAADASVVGPAFQTPEQAAETAAVTGHPSSSSIAAAAAASSTHQQQHEHTKKRLTQQYMQEEISLDKLTEVLHHIAGPSKTFTPEEVRALFQLADLDHSKTISFREFLICVSIGYFLKVDESAFPEEAPTDPTATAATNANADSGPATASSATPTATTTPANKPKILIVRSSAAAATAAAAGAAGTASGSSSTAAPSPSTLSASISPSTFTRQRTTSSSLGSDFSEIQKGFRMVEKAFRDIDEDNSQSVDVGELKRALFATTQIKDQTLLELRFAEMDFNGDGDINFPEFLYGMTAWVGYEEEDGSDQQ